MSHDTYWRDGYTTASEQLAGADLETLREASRRLRERYARVDYASREGKRLLGAMSAVTDLVTAAA